MFDGIYPEGNFSWHHLWFLAYLFLMALLISPFLRYLRSERFERAKVKMINFLSKPLALNMVAVILVLSQAILRTYFPDQTNALYNDWAYFVYYFLFFIAGFVLMSNSKMITAITRQRRWYLLETLIATGFMFSISTLFENTVLKDWLYGISGIIIGWSCGLAALGYSKRYLNKNTRWRKTANEAIYPFYLLHQPVIIAVGYYIHPVVMPVVLKMIILTVLSFMITIAIYRVLIKPFNITRFMFGLKKISATSKSKKIALENV